jgi:predicted transcriptional regulator
MARQEVLELLANNRGRWFTSTEIRDALGMSNGTIAVTLRKLRKTSEVKFKKVWCKDKHYRMKYCYGNGNPCFIERA